MHVSDNFGTLIIAPACELVFKEIISYLMGTLIVIII